MPAQQPSQQPSEQNRTRTRTGPARRKLGRALILPLAATAAGVLLLYNALTAPAELPPPAHSAAEAPAPAGSPAVPGQASGAEQALPRSVPTRITIPEIGVDAPFVPLAIGESGQLDPPPRDDSNLAGWFEDGAAPGERGSSIVVGHVDTMDGPAVFARLNELKPGSSVSITREDGITATFTVHAMEVFSKADFPDDRVYADTPSPSLRLITCAGAYDRETRNYEDNLVAFARLDSAERT
ncbi:class F sortase [Streptomyces sp. YIM 98790]|uniref:class F sortase n=1 Tax=Streptomyces sp. YIM 98790 TaxID=2689077 RepID=UPI00140CD88B|nr:class F sortase [Streptomyces sp. YIM 98790]